MGAFLSVAPRSIRAVPTPGIRSSDADACPGALRLHAAADGPLARVRLPGGRLTGNQLRAVRELAETFGDGHIELTSRANIQLRALTGAPVETLGARLAAAGLLPSSTHELVRNIAASPLPGPDEAVDIRALVPRLDRALCADPRLSTLPGRFLFALDSGALDVARTADVAAVPATALDEAPDTAGTATLAPAVDGTFDVTHISHGETAATLLGGRPRGEIAILFDGFDAGLRVPPGDVVDALLAAAHAFLDERAVQAADQRSVHTGSADRRSAQAGTVGQQPAHTATIGQQPAHAGTAHQQPTHASSPDQQPTHVGTADGRTAQAGVEPAGSARPAWRVRELVDGPARVAARVAETLGVQLGVGAAVPEPVIREPVGIIAQPGGLVALGAVVPLGRVSSVQIKVLEEAAAIVVTPWRGVVLPDLSPSAAQRWQSGLAAVGLEVRSGSRWSGVTACAGRPGCAKSLADVRQDATAAVLAGCDGARAVHWVGCSRGCGSPAGSHVRVEATGSGYEVRAGGFCVSASADEVGALVAAARRS